MNLLKRLFQFEKLRLNINCSKQKLEKLQNKKLKKMLKHIYQNSVYYHELLSDKGFNDKNIDSIKLDDIPTINKREFISHFDEIVTRNNVSQKRLTEIDAKEAADVLDIHLIHSSGSTGAPAYFFYDEAAWNEMEAGILRAALWDMSFKEVLSFLLHKPRILYIAATEGRYAGNTAVLSGVEQLGFKQLQLSVQMPLEEMISKVNDFDPEIIIGYPSAIKIIASLAKENNVKTNVSRVITCGEPLSTQVREFIKTVFSCKIINVYGASESMALGVSGDLDDCMYLFDDLNVIEYINGKMYLTNLYNYAQPIIRYELGDELHIINNKNAKKCNFTMVNNVEGRSEDILWFSDNEGKKEYLHPLSIEGVCVEGVLDYQFCKTDKTTFEMNVEIQAGYIRDKIKKEILEIIQPILLEKRLEYIKFHINFVDRIRPDEITGKKKLIIDKAGGAI